MKRKRNPEKLYLIAINKWTDELIIKVVNSYLVIYEYEEDHYAIILTKEEINKIKKVVE